MRRQLAKVAAAGVRRFEAREAAAKTAVKAELATAIAKARAATVVRTAVKGQC